MAKIKFFSGKFEKPKKRRKGVHSKNAPTPLSNTFTSIPRVTLLECL